MRFADQHYLWFALLSVPMAVIFMAIRQPSSRFSSGRFLKLHVKRWRASTILEFLLFLVVLLAAIVTLARPQLARVQETETIVARDIVTIVDKSGSMKDPISDPDQLATVRSKANPKDATLPTIRKIDAARTCLQFFIPLRAHDRIALFEFDSSTYANWPLSKDHAALLAEVEKLGTAVDGGTNFEGPTQSDPSIGCFQGGINHFREMQPGSTTRFLIVLTDGEVEAAEGLDKRRFLEIVGDLKALDIKLIVIGVGDSWTANPETDPKGQKTKDIRRLVKEVDGRLFTVGDARQMKKVFQEISDTAPSEVRMEKLVDWSDIYPACALATSFLVVLLFAFMAVVERRP